MIDSQFSFNEHSSSRTHYRIHPANKLNYLLSFKHFEAKTPGMLVAIYEHKVYVRSMIYAIIVDTALASLDGPRPGLWVYINMWKGE